MSNHLFYISGGEFSPPAITAKNYDLLVLPFSSQPMVPTMVEGNIQANVLEDF